jgi:hypothetical protein
MHMVKKISGYIGIATIVATMVFGIYQIVRGTFLVAEANTCNAQADLTGEIYGNITVSSGALAKITNKSHTCSYSAGLAIYRVYDNEIKNQKLYDNEQLTIGPNKTIDNIRVSVPGCKYQVDLFSGPVITSFNDDGYYGDRKLDHKLSGGDFCGHTTPSPSPTPNPTPSSIPAPTVSTYCDSNTSKVGISWNAANRDSQGYHLNVTTDGNFNNGGWSKAFSRGTNSVTLTNFNDFATFGGKSGTLSFNPDQTYRVRIYYPATGEVSSIVTLTPVRCSNTSSSDFSVVCRASASSVTTGRMFKMWTEVSGTTGSSVNYHWSGSEGIDSRDSEIFVRFNNVGSKSVDVTVSSGGRSATARCNTEVSETPNVYNNDSLNGSCWANTSNGRLYDTIVWSASASGGNGDYTYSWSGNDNLNGYGNAISRQYSSYGPKQATVAIYSNGQTIYRSCNTDIRSYTGGITVINEPGPTNTGGVYLSQVPYTGSSDNLKIAAFILALLVWSAGVAYFLVSRKAKKQGLTVTQFISNSGRSLAFASATAMSVDNKITALKEAAVIEKTNPVIDNLPTDETYTQFFGTSSVNSSKGDIIAVLEHEARNLETLVSADGLDIIAQASNYNKHTALILLAHLVDLYKSSHPTYEHEWTVLNAERVNQILFSTYITMAPTFVEWLVKADEKKTFAFLRMLQMQGQSVKSFINHLVLELDKAKNYRADTAYNADATIVTAAEQWSDDQLEYVMNTLVESVDHVSKSAYSSIKIAVMHIVEMSKSVTA